MLDDSYIGEIIRIAKIHGVDKVILFGSRARGTNTPRSDIDLAVSGGNFDSFWFDLKENAQTLLSLDIISLDKGISEELRNEIKRDGVILYEKDR